LNQQITPTVDPSLEVSMSGAELEEKDSALQFNLPGSIYSVSGEGGYVYNRAISLRVIYVAIVFM
jgi:hypothetical protein